MKKALSAIAFSCIAALSMTSLAACGSSHTHTYGDWVLTTTPSTTEHGVLTRTCSGDSSHTETKFMPYLNSTDYTVELVNATCTTAGYCTYTWKNTNYTINGAQIAITVYTGYEATGHSYTSEVTTAATCTEDGVMTYTCSSCGDTYTDAIPATGHSYAYTSMTWTATSDGYTAAATYTCANGHTTNVAATVSSSTTPATCTTDGKTVYTATVAATDSLTGVAITETKEVTIPATNHSYTYTGITWTETSNGYTAVANYVCANDGTHTATVTANVSSEKTESTCTTAGNITYTATVSASESLTGTAVSDTKVVALNKTDHTAGTAVKEYEVAATCTTDASYDLVVYCTECGAEMSRDHVVETGTATGHNYALDENGWAWTEDAQNGGYTASASFTCSSCGDTKTVSATVTSETTEATCTTDGKIVYTATISAENSPTGEAISDTKEVTIEATGHDYTSEVTKEATCTEDGEITYTCSACGDTYTETIPATGHDYEAVVTAPTCTEGGYTTYTCSTCGDTYTADETEATGHDYEAVVTAPTCTEGGYTTYTCSVCGDSYVADETEATGHSWGEGVVTKEATCTEDGVKTYTCSTCGDTYTEAIPATGHNYEAVVTEPTCTEKGYTTYTCSVCGDSYVADETEATGHSWGATLTYSDNSWYKTCTVCEDKVAVTENYSDYAFLADSADALSSALTIGGNILLTADISGNVIYTVANSVTTTLDLNGCTLASTVSGTITVEEGATLTVTDSSTTGNGKITTSAVGTGTTSAKIAYAINNQGTLNVNGGTITTEGKEAVAIYNNGGTLYINGGTVSVTYSGSGATYGIFNNGTLYLTDGAITGTNTYGLYNYCAVAYISGGTITGNNYAIYNGGSSASYGILYISGGTFTYAMNVAYCYNLSETYVTGGSVDSLLLYNNTGKTTIYVIDSLKENVTINNYYGDDGTASGDGYELVAASTTIDVDGTTTAATCYSVYMTENSAHAYLLHEGVKTYYATFTNALSKAVSGDTVILLKDSVSSASVATARTITIDLNGHNLVSNGTTAILTINHKSAVVTIKNSAETESQIIYSGEYATSNYAIKLAGGSLTIGSNIKIVSSSIGITLWGTSSQKATLNMNGGEIEAYSFAISTNGDSTRGNDEININGGTITSTNAPAIYLPGQSGVVTISGTDESPVTISGTTGVEIRAGSLTISGNVTITAIGSFTAVANGGGSTTTGVAIAISQHTTNKDITVVINGGTFSGEYAVYEADLQDTSYDNIKVTINGGKFSGSVASTSTYTVGENTYKALSITGGTYTTDVSTYVASGYTCSESEGSYTVTATNTEGD